MYTVQYPYYNNTCKVPPHTTTFLMIPYRPHHKILSPLDHETIIIDKKFETALFEIFMTKVFNRVLLTLN